MDGTLRHLSGPLNSYWTQLYVFMHSLIFIDSTSHESHSIENSVEQKNVLRLESPIEDLKT